MTTLSEDTVSSSSQPASLPVPARRSGNHKTPSTFWFVVKDGRTARSVLTRYRRRRLVRLGYACPVWTMNGPYPDTIPDCTVTLDDTPA